MKKIALASALTLAFAGAALAAPDAKKEAPKPADKATPADKAAPAKPEAAPPMEMKPAAEMEQLKGMVGSWKCSGKVTAMGQEQPSESTMKTAFDMDNYWVMSNMAEKKKAKGPAYKSHDMITYDASQKAFVRFGVDNMGGWSMATSKGWNGDKMEWTGGSKMMGQEFKMTDVITKAADGKSFAVSGFLAAGADKPVQWEMTCKK